MNYDHLPLYYSYRFNELPDKVVREAVLSFGEKNKPFVMAMYNGEPFPRKLTYKRRDYLLKKWLKKACAINRAQVSGRWDRFVDAVGEESIVDTVEKHGLRDPFIFPEERAKLGVYHPLGQLYL